MKCLVAAIEEDMLDIDRKEGEPYNVSPECKAELKFELLQKHSNVNLNPSIVSNSRSKFLTREGSATVTDKFTTFAEIELQGRVEPFVPRGSHPRVSQGAEAL